jgi:hypothetical protein
MRLCATDAFSTVPNRHRSLLLGVARLVGLGIQVHAHAVISLIAHHLQSVRASDSPRTVYSFLCHAPPFVNSRSGALTGALAHRERVCIAPTR